MGTCPHLFKEIKMKVYIEYMLQDVMYRKIIYNVEFIVRKSRSYIHIFEKINNDLKEHSFPVEAVFNMVID